jgi:hypothetical protein
MSADQRVREHRDEILRVATFHGAGNVMLFGSVARGEDTPESDVDRKRQSNRRVDRAAKNR